MTTLDLKRRAMLFGKETQGPNSPLWSRKLVLSAEDLKAILESPDYKAWNTSKRDFLLDEIVNQTWIKTCSAGHITEVKFLPDNKIQETTVFDRGIIPGEWHLIDGIIHLKLFVNKDTYDSDIVANNNSSIHSAIEFENGRLHTYLKVFQLK